LTKSNELPVEGGPVVAGATPASADEAMSQYAQGRAEAFEIVYDAVAPRLEGYLRRHVREAARVEDIIQQTFLHMHSARGDFIIGAEVLPWAFAIARRLMIDSVRKTRREQQLDLTDEHDAHVKVLAAAVATGEEEVQAKEARARITAEYQRLTEPQRVAFDLVKVDGMSYSQAAAIVGTTVTGVKLRVHRAFCALRAALGDRQPSSANLTASKERDEPVS
jgi:RNA polymerase sigma-70 factor (ECF subfamily)